MKTWDCLKPVPENICVWCDEPRTFPSQEVRNRHQERRHADVLSWPAPPRKREELQIRSDFIDTLSRFDLQLCWTFTSVIVKPGIKLSPETHHHSRDLISILKSRNEIFHSDTMRITQLSGAPKLLPPLSLLSRQITPGTVGGCDAPSCREQATWIRWKTKLQAAFLCPKHENIDLHFTLGPIN